MTDHVSVLAVGASVSTGALVTELRDSGHRGRIVVLDRDPDMPYDRPPLSKEFLTSTEDRPDAPWWNEGCEIITAEAEKLDVATRTVAARMPDGTALMISADHVVLATGSAPVRIPGQPDGVLQLRTADDARSLRALAAARARVIILGAGTVGTEIASSLVSAGTQVCLIDLADRPLDRFFAGHLGAEATDWIRAGGVDLRLETHVVDFRHDGRNWTVITDRGPIEADAVVSAVGTRPITTWLDDAGIALGDGILCDHAGRVLSIEGTPLDGIHAIGDAASWRVEDGTHRRREDWTSAQRQGSTLARRLWTGDADGTVPDRAYFWTTQFGRRIQVLGTPVRDGVLIEHVVDSERQAAFYTVEHEGLSVAWISINRPREFALAMRNSTVSAT